MMSITVGTTANPLDRVITDRDRAMQLMLWKIRHQYPDLALVITEQDIAKLDACCDYLKVQPAALAHRPDQRGPKDKEPRPAPFVVITLVAKGTTNVIRAVENDEADFERQKLAEQARRIATAAPATVARLLDDLRRGSYSEGEIADALRDMETLAKVVAG